MNTKRKRTAGRPTAQGASELDVVILRAAMEVFHEKGFSGASLVAIAERARTSRQTLYARYPGKRALYEALIKKHTAELLAAIASILEDQGPPKFVLERFGRRFVSTFVNSDLQRLHRSIIAESRTFPKLANAFFENGPIRGKKLVTAYLQKQNRSGLLHISDVEYAAEQFVGSLVGTVIIRSTLSQAPILGTSFAIGRWVDIAVATFLSAYGRPPL